MSQKIQNKSQEVCRMSWFLIEMDEGQSKGGKMNGKIVYSIMHTVELIDNVSDMYIDRKVRFNWNNVIMEGQIKLASDNRHFVEEELKVLTKNNEEALKLNLSRRFLVQYNKGANSMVHAIIHQTEIVWPKVNLNNLTIKDVLIRDGKIQRIATLLHINDSDDLMQKELNVLKTRCFEGAFKDPNGNLNIEPWLLVQYSSGPGNVIYSIINLNDTVWQDKNLYPNVVAYIAEEESVFQAIIIRKSGNRNELENKLSLIRDSCLRAEFPIAPCFTIKIDVPPLDDQDEWAKPIAMLPRKGGKLKIIRN